MRQSVASFSSGQLRSIAGMVTGAFAVNALVNFGRNTLQRADDLGNFSNAVGVNVESLQALTWAMKEFGAASEDSARAKLVKLVDSQGKVINGNKSLAEAFQRLGISEREVASLGTAELLQRVAVGAQTSGTAVADLNEIFGRGSAFEMKDALDKLANDGMSNLITQAKAAGQVLDQELIGRLGQLNDDLERTSQQMGNFFVNIAAKGSNKFKDFFAFLGAASAVGLKEASRQMRNGEIGTEAERAEAAKGRPKEADRRGAEQAAREAALSQRKAQEAAALQAKIDAIMNAPSKSFAAGAPQAADQYARIGLFSGGQVNNRERMVSERQLAATQETARRLARIEELQGRTATATEATAERMGE
jgi:hypothetical protein